MPVRAALFALALVLLAPLPSAGEPIPALPGRPAQGPASPILFETSFPLVDLRVKDWTGAQKREVAGIVERMKKDPGIRLVVQVRTDPIGSRDENAHWGNAVARAVADRLVASGVPGARIAAAPGGEDGDLGSRSRWADLGRHQRVVIRGMRGSDGLRPPGRTGESLGRNSVPHEGVRPAGGSHPPGERR